MNRAVDQDHVREGRSEPLDGGVATVRGAVVGDPENATRRRVRRLRHHLGDQSIERDDPGRRLAPTEDLGPMDVERGQVGQGATARVFVFDAHRLSRGGGRGGMQPHAGLNAGLFIGAENEIVGAQRMAVPPASIEVEDATGLHRKLRIAREDPGPVLPRANRVFMQPAPDGLVADRGDDAGALGLAQDIRGAQARQRHAERGGQFTRERLDLDHDLWGGKLGGDPSADARRGRAHVHRRNACATG